MVVEVNANPYLERTSAFALAALQAGLGYTSLIGRIAEIAWRRSEPTPFLKELQKARSDRVKVRRQVERALHRIEPPQEVNPGPADGQAPPSGG
jgi:hypothetical protein